MREQGVLTATGCMDSVTEAGAVWDWSRPPMALRVFFRCAGCDCARGRRWMDTVAIVLKWLSTHFLSLTRC